MTRIEVRTRRLILRPLKTNDFEAWLDAMTNGLPAQSRWDFNPKSKKQCSANVFEELLSAHDFLAGGDQYYRWSVFKKNNLELVGHIDFQIFMRASLQFANFGYQIYNRHWGKGYGKEAALAGLKLGFTHLHLNRLEAAIHPGNRVSIQLAKSIGMKKECVRKNYWFEDGKWEDHLIYSANPADIGLKAKHPVRSPY